MKIQYFVGCNEDLTPVYKHGGRVSHLIKYGQAPTEETLEVPVEEDYAEEKAVENKQEEKSKRQRKNDYVNNLLNNNMSLDDLSDIDRSNRFKNAVRRRYARSVNKQPVFEKTIITDEPEINEYHPRYTIDRGKRHQKEVIFKDRSWIGPHNTDERQQPTWITRADKTRRRATVKVLKPKNENIYSFGRDEKGNRILIEPFVGKRKVVIKNPEKEERWKKRHGFV